jgi:hypothetical protein
MVNDRYMREVNEKYGAATICSLFIRMGDAQIASLW